ncbi:MAG: hypothetical protein PHO37_14970 [Kiritimatiellae bacterium]|nr:hypothetical protein [Kiritimatiellia bacterium]
MTPVFGDSFSEYQDLKKYLTEICNEFADNPVSVRFEVIDLSKLSIDKNLSSVPDYFEGLIKHYKETDRCNPTITIGIEDINSKEWESSAVYKLFHIDPRYAWIDSSIWLRYIQLTNIFEVDLKNLLSEIALYYQLGMYNTLVARENLDLMLRKLEQNYINDFKRGKTGSHAKDITPYIYHSETKLRKQAQKTCEKVLKYLNNSQDRQVWRCLLVDDHSDTQLTHYFDKPDTRSVIELLNELLNRISDECLPKKRFKEGFKSFFHFDCKPKDDPCGYVDYALKRIYQIDRERNGFELIILDYLLKQDGDSKTKEKGTELLVELHKEEKESIGKCQYRGPSDRFWIIPLTAHSSAFQDELIVQGIPHYDKDWCITEGADLASTPNKFLWIMLSTIHIQLQESIFELEDINMFFAVHPFISKDEDNLQSWALYALGSFVNRFGKYTRYMMETPKSGFGKFVHEYYMRNADLRFYYKSFVNLLMLISSGSKTEWREMYERITRIEKKLSVEKESYESIIETFDEIKKTLEEWAASAQ